MRMESIWHGVHSRIFEPFQEIWPFYLRDGIEHDQGIPRFWHILDEVSRLLRKRFDWLHIFFHLFRPLKHEQIPFLHYEEHRKDRDISY